MPTRMAPKKQPPTRFKFKYVSFNERLASLNVGLLHDSRIDVARTENSPGTGGEQSHFVEALERCRDLDLTSHYREFVGKLPASHKLTTLAQVLHESKSLARLLLKYLVTCPSVSLASLLDLSVALARDLRQEYYRYFWRFYDNVCLKISNADTAEVVELCFMSLTQMFRFLWKALLSKENFEPTFDRIFELLSSPGGHTKRFTAEAASFLVRKIDEESYDDFLTFCIRRASENDSLGSGIADLLFSSVKGAGTHFHSSAPTAVTKWITCIGKDWDISAWVAVRSVFLALHERCIAFSTAGAAGFDLIWGPMVKALNREEARGEVCDLLMESLSKWLGHKGGCLVGKPNEVVSDIQNLVKRMEYGHFRFVLPGLGAFVIERIADSDKHLLVETIAEIVRNSVNDHLQSTLDFIWKVAQLGAVFDGNLLQHVVKLAERLVLQNSFLPLEFLMFFCKLSQIRQSCSLGKYSVCCSESSLAGYVLKLLTGDMPKEPGVPRQSWLCALYLSAHVNCLEYNMAKALSAEILRLSDTKFQARCLAYFMRALHLSSLADEATTTALFPLEAIRELISGPRRIKSSDLLRFLNRWAAGIPPEAARSIAEAVARDCFCDPDAHVRRAAVRFCAQTVEELDVFPLLLQADEHQLNAINYRERIRILRQVSLLHVETEWIQLAVFRYLIGSFYVNFEPLWAPLIDMIAEVASRLSSDKVIGILFGFLSTVTTEVRANPDPGCPDLDEVDFEKEDFGKMNLTPDHGNVRLLILRLMENMAHTVETYHRDFIPLLLDFVSTEFDKIDQVTSFRVNLMESFSENAAGMDSGGGDASAGEVKRTLVAYLNVLKGFHNPRAVYLSPKVTRILDVLLASPSPMLQNAALKCFFAYRYKWLSPHREQLEKLMSREGFTEQIIDFGLDLKSVESEARASLVDLLLKICYGQLLSRSEKRKGGVKARRSQIFRFLGTCSGDEIKKFVLELALKPMSDLLSLDLQESVERVCQEYTLENAIPPRKLFGMLSSLGLALGSISGAMEHLASKLVQALLVFAAILQKMDEKPLAKWVKILKRDLVRRLIQLLDVFDYTWTEEEKDYLLRVVIGPGIARVSRDAVSAPTSTLKLMTYLAQREDFLSVLWSTPDKNQLPALDIAMELLADDAVSTLTTEEVLACAANLVSTGKADLLTSYAEKILNFAKKLLSTAEGASLSENAITVLLAITDLCADEDSASVISTAILNNVASQSPAPEVATQQLQVAAKLTPIAGSYPLASVSHLLLHTSDRGCREELFSVVGAVSKCCGDILRRMSANQEARLDEPAYDTRFAALAQIRAQLKMKTDVHITSNDFACYIHALAHEIANSEDMALRDGYGFTLQTLIASLPSSRESADLKQMVISVVKTGLNSRQEEARFEFVMILRSFVIAFPQGFADVLPLLSDSDPESDFLKNLCHIQIAKRGAALRKVEMNAQLARFSADFLHPILVGFLKDPSYAKQNILHDDVIGFISKVYSFLPWRRYFPFLKRLLRDLTSNFHETKELKLQTKVFVAVLSAYHYGSDETKATAVMQTGILPKLMHFIATDTHLSHQQSQGYSEEKRSYERDLCKAPLVLGIIRVLKNLPDNAVEDSLPNLVSKLCSLLRSAFYEVRETARKNLIAIVRVLGPKYLKYIISELRGILTRGFHQEVMLNSVNILINNLQDDLQPGDLDPVIADLLALTNMQLFQDENAKDASAPEQILAVKLPERKAAKAIQTYRILGRFASEESIVTLLTNVKSLVSSGSFRKSTDITLMERLCALTADGLAINTKLDLKSLLVFAHSIVADVKREEKNEAARLVNELERDVGLKGKGWVKPDSFIVDPEPKRTGATPVKPKWTLDHVLIEFALDMLLQLFRKGRLDKTTPFHASLLNPFVPHVVQGIRSQHVRIVTLALRALGQLIPFRLPNIADSTESIIGQLFVLMHQWSKIDSTSNQPDVLELNLILFKVFTMALRELGYDLTPKQMRVVLQYAEQVLNDTQRSHAGFALLRVLCAKRLSTRDDQFAKELKEVVDRLRTQMIRSTSEAFRSNGMAVLTGYLKASPIGERTEILRFFLVQLEYSEESGRLCALDVLFELLTMPPPEGSENFEESVVLQVVLHLIAFYNNEESEKCRKSAFVLLKRVITMMTEHNRQELIKRSLEWTDPDQTSRHRVALLILKLAVELDLLPRDQVAEVVESTSVLVQKRCEEVSRDAEAAIFQALKLFEHVLSSDAADLSDEIREEIWRTNLLVSSHPYSWITLQSAKITGLFLSANRAITVDSSIMGDLVWKPVRLLREDDQLFAKLLENLSLLHRVDGASIRGICESLVKLCKPEITGSMNTDVRRQLLFRWMAQVVKSNSVGPYTQKNGSALASGLSTLSRELLLPNISNSDLKIAADEAAAVVKIWMGSEAFAALLTDAKKTAISKRKRRKQEAAITKLNPLDVDGVPKKKKRLRS